MRGLLKLTWLETKIFAREPMGMFGTLLMPVIAFIGLGRVLGGLPSSMSGRATGFLTTGLPVFASILISISAVTSLVTIISIYREGGILKRLRATPLSPATILTAHVLVKLLFTAATLVLMVLAGRRYYPVGVDAPFFSFTIALIVATWSVLSVGFVIASVVPTARFAQPITAAVLYPMVALSGLFAPLDAFPAPVRLLAAINPLTHAVSLLRGIWTGEGWGPHLGDVAALVLVFAVCTLISSRVFRWQ